MSDPTPEIPKHLQKPLPVGAANKAVSTGNPILDFLLNMVLPFLTSPTTLAIVLNVILQTIKNTQSKQKARDIELTAFRTLGTMNPGDPDFTWPRQ